MQKMKSLLGCRVISYNGERYDVDEKGEIEVHQQMVNILLSHGFVVVPDAPVVVDDENKIRRGRPRKAAEEIATA